MYNKFVVDGKPEEEIKKEDSIDEDKSGICSDEDEEVKMIEKDFKLKWEKHERTELEELE